MSINRAMPLRWKILLVALPLVCLAAAPAMATWGNTSARDSLLNMVSQYQQILDRNDPNSPHVAQLQQLSDSISLMTEEQDQLATMMLGPVLITMQEDLDELVALMAQKNAQMEISRIVAQSSGFPDANYPDVDIPGTAVEFANSLPGIWEGIGMAIGLAFGGDVSDYYPEDMNGSEIPGVCKGDPDGDGIANRKSDSLLISSQAILNSMDFSREISGRICDQDLTIVGEGGNLSVACIAVDVIYLIPKYLFDQIQACEDAIDTAEIEGTYQRIGHVHGDLNVMSTDMGAYYANIMSELLVIHTKLEHQEALLDMVLDNQDHIIKLLNTPNGKRPNWPLKSSTWFFK